MSMSTFLKAVVGVFFLFLVGLGIMDRAKASNIEEYTVTNSDCDYLKDNLLRVVDQKRAGIDQSVVNAFQLDPDSLETASYRAMLPSLIRSTGDIYKVKSHNAEMDVVSLTYNNCRGRDTFKHWKYLKRPDIN